MSRTTTTKKTTKTRSKAEQSVTTEKQDTPAEAAKILGKRELIDRVVEVSGIKKKAAKPVVEAMLKELGDALSRGETLNLQPFGKGIVKNRKELDSAFVIEMRLRRSKLALASEKTASLSVVHEAAE